MEGVGEGFMLMLILVVCSREAGEMEWERENRLVRLGFGRWVDIFGFEVGKLSRFIWNSREKQILQYILVMLAYSRGLCCLFCSFLRVKIVRFNNRMLYSCLEY